MAERRMFAKAIIESDPFMDMPAEAQMLYIRLNMAADDDGFCDNPRSIMRSCGASDDSMKLLLAKKFVLTFSKKDNFVVVIKHWRLNNYIRKDTYHETKYKEFMRELYYDENNSYSLNPGDGHRPCLTPSDDVLFTPSRSRDEAVTEPSRTRDEPLTQYSIGKDRVSLEEESVVQENNTLNSLSEEKEKEKEAQFPIIPPDQERIEHFGRMLSFFRGRGIDVANVYSLAESDGVTREMLDAWVKENGT